MNHKRFNKKQNRKQSVSGFHKMKKKYIIIKRSAVIICRIYNY